MAIKAPPLGKIFLAIGLLLVMFKGLSLHPLVREQLFPREDAKVEMLDSARKASLKIQDRLAVLKDLVHHLFLIQDAIQGGAVSEEGHFKGVSYPLLEIGVRLFPNIIWEKELRLAEKERVNVERKMENLEIILCAVERELDASQASATIETSPSSAYQVKTLQQVEMIRRHLMIDGADLRDLSEKLTNVKNDHGR